MADLFDIRRPDENLPGNGGGINSEIILVQEEDVHIFPSRTADLVTVSGNIILKSGKASRVLYMTQETISPKQKKVMGDNSDSGAWETILEGTHPGISDLILKFNAMFGFRFRGYVFIRDLVKNKMFFIGEPGNPVTIADSDFNWSSKSKGTKFVFKSEQSSVVGIYTGAYPFQNAVGS